MVKNLKAAPLRFTLLPDDSIFAAWIGDAPGANWYAHNSVPLAISHITTLSVMYLPMVTKHLLEGSNCKT